MATDYLSFFKLNDDPFRLTPDTAYFYNSPAHSTAFLSIEYCVTQKEGFCVLTGEPGTGKTTIIRLFTEKWKDRAEIALIMTPHLSPDEFFRAILDDFKIPLSQSKNDMLKAFRSFLLTHAANDKRVAIIVDEAQELPAATLEELRLLSNLETEKEKLLQIILIGQPELRTRLLTAPLRQLNQRITVRVQLKPLTEAESSDYINTRLIKGGNSSLLFNQKAKDLIFTLSDGIPRTINLLASRGLMSAFLDGSKEVFEKHVQKGATDVMEPPTPDNATKPSTSGERRLKSTTTKPTVSGEGKSTWRTIAVLAAVLILAAGAGASLYFHLFNTLFSPHPAANTTNAATPVKPVTAPISSVRLVNRSSATTTAASTGNPFTANVAKELAVADPLQTAFTSFNSLAHTWHIDPAAKLTATDTAPEKYLEALAGARGMHLLYFYGTLDQLLELDYPAIIVTGTSSSGKAIYTTLISSSGAEYAISPAVAGKNMLTRHDMEIVWHGKAILLWKNHKMIPSQIAAGARSNETAALQKLLARTGAPAAITGVFDHRTADALKSYQALKGLKVTGQPDPQTLLYLYKESTDLYRPKLKQTNV